MSKPTIVFRDHRQSDVQVTSDLEPKLKDAVLNDGREFWGRESAVSVLYFSGGGSDTTISRMSLTLHGGDGFLVKHKIRYTDDPFHSAYSGDGTDSISAASQQHFSKYKVSRADAWRAIEHFMNTGGRLPELSWEPELLPDGQVEQGIPLQTDKISFRSSLGKQTSLTEASAVGKLRKAVLTASDNYWTGDSGAAIISYRVRDDDMRSGIATMHLIGREEFGFIVYQRDAADGANELIAIGPDRDNKDTVVAELGGQPHWHYRKYCLPRAKAWEVIEYFIETGERYPQVDWEREERDDNWEA